MVTFTCQNRDMLINKDKKAVINMRLLLTVQLRNFQTKDIVCNPFNCASQHIIVFIVACRFTCILTIGQHEYESLPSEAAQNTSIADGKYFQAYQ